MQDVTDGNINCVIVKDLSRLGRDYIETGRYLRRVFPAYGVRFIAITDSIDTDVYKRQVQKLWAILLCFLLFMLFKFMFCRTLREY